MSNLYVCITSLYQNSFNLNIIVNKIISFIGDPVNTPSAKLAINDCSITGKSVKPPAFWQNKPKLWFLQLEAQFSNSSISNDTTKYNIFVAALDENVLDFVVDILSNPRHDDKYETLKNALLNRLTDTEESRLKKLLTDMELGDRRPSDLLRQMKRLAGSSISNELIKSLWLQRLPQQTQAILSISKDSLILQKWLTKFLLFTAHPKYAR
ncbi:uncharacterized protein TNIN_116141 [Trichonephila inaurata madagascariensis]|uniref:DUF7041 domain-containing protein n=1 Tax=Trichonephila inaurata madagascariensis TaxID=2747483 RepID=A0A8X6WQL8_9ARAC|nr:uncharacterized protein TNIN_116141 [Trichonephila inaurata madagascariensis]